MRRQISVGVHARNRPAKQQRAVAIAEDLAVFNAHIGQRFFVDGHEGQREIRNILLHREADIHRHNALRVFDFLRRGIPAIQREGDMRHDIRQLVGRALIDNAAAVSLPGQRFAVHGEGFMTADVYDILQHRAIRKNLLRIAVFKMNVIQQSLHLAIVVDHHINALVLDRFCAGGAASRYTKRRQQRNRLLFHKVSILS